MKVLDSSSIAVGFWEGWKGGGELEGSSGWLYDWVMSDGCIAAWDVWMYSIAWGLTWSCMRKSER